MSDTAQNKGGNPKGTSQVRNSGVMKIQALAMMRELALGKSESQVAQQFNVSRSIVKARLSYAQRAGLFVRHEDVILTQMVPQAEAVLLGILNPHVVVDPELKAKVALEVMKGTGLLRKPGTAAPAALQGANKKSQMTLEDYINSLRGDDGTLPEGEIVDVEYSITGEPRPPALTPGGDEPADEEQASTGRADGAYGEPSPTARAPHGEADEATGDGDGGYGTDVSEALGQGLGEARREDSSEPEGARGDESDSEDSDVREEATGSVREH